MNTLSDSVFHSRAVRSINVPIEDDPDPMVHQQLARLLFMKSVIDVEGKYLLEFGCGSGLNCSFLTSRTHARHVAGFDLSSDSVHLAKEHYPGLDFRIADACDPSLDVSPGTWDVIVSFEVLEHVHHLDGFLTNIRRHLAPGGAAFISTPNRDVFSLGHHPSPMNREHLNELDYQELFRLLSGHFASIEIWGQQFKDKKLQDSWDADVRQKIALLKAGVRWERKAELREKLRGMSIVDAVYQNRSVRRLWKYVRWNLWRRLEVIREIAERPYTYLDFEFTKDVNKALWFCAVMKNDIAENSPQP